MCGQDEICEESRNTSHFEKDRSGGQFELLAIKRFKRPAADINMNDPEIIRPSSILFMTLEYIRDCIIDQDLLPPGSSTYKYESQGQVEH